MGWSLLPDALQPFKIYCASPSITSQLVLFLCQTVEIGPLGHVRVSSAVRQMRGDLCTASDFTSLLPLSLAD